MATIEPYCALNIKLLHMFAQYRPESHWPLIIKVFYYLWRLFIYFCYITTLTFSFLGIVVFGYDQISDVAMNIVNMLLYLSVSTRSVYFMYHHKTVEYLILRLNAVMKECGTFAFEPFTMQRGRSISNKILTTWMSFVLGAGLFMAFPPFFKSIKELPLPMWLFYDWTDNRYYIPTLIVQTFSQIFMVSCFGNIEMFNACFNILLTHQFKLLGDDLTHLFPNALFKCGMSKEEVEEFMLKNESNNQVHIKVQKMSETQQFKNVVNENLKVCIRHHQEMMTFRDEFYTFISPLLITELNFLFAYLIFTLFTFITTTNKSIYLALSQYFGGTVAQIYIMTFVGERLTNQVENLRYVFYAIPWYFCDRTFLKHFRLVQLRMTKNDYLKAGKLLPISLETCLEFMKKAASFFAVLRQVSTEE